MRNYHDGRERRAPGALAQRYRAGASGNRRRSAPEHDPQDPERSPLGTPLRAFEDNEHLRLTP
ncbi:hypothetical protein GCM10027570_54260 [Streptomonospora sediminis]